MKYTLALDMDGTITENNSWALVHDFYKTNLPDWTDLFEEKKIDLLTWVKRDLPAVLKKYKTNDDDLLLSKLKLKPGFEDFLEKWALFFRKSGGISIISGGVPFIVKALGKKYKIDTHTVEYEKYTDKVIIKKAMDGQDKQKILQEYAKKGRVIYVADNSLKGFELKDYGDNIIKIIMDNYQKGKYFVKDFYELDKIIPDLIKQ